MTASQLTATQLYTQAHDVQSTQRKWWELNLRSQLWQGQCWWGSATTLFNRWVRLVIKLDRNMMTQIDAQTIKHVCHEVTKQAIYLRTALLILAGSVEWSNACHYPLKGCRQGKKMMRWKGRVYLAWGTRCTGLQGKDQENLTEVLWWPLWPLYMYYYNVCTCVY